MSDLFLATAVEIGSDTGSRLGAGLVVTVIGMGVVFGVLLLLFGLMVLIGRFGGPAVARDQSAGLAAAPPALVVSDAPPDAPVTDEEPVVTGATAVGAPRRALVIAAVAAALAAAMESETSAPPVVRHGRQAGPRRPQMNWALAGRMELVTARERLPRGSRGVRGARS